MYAIDHEDTHRVTLINIPDQRELPLRLLDVTPTGTPVQSEFDQESTIAFSAPGSLEPRFGSFVEPERPADEEGPVNLMFVVNTSMSASSQPGVASPDAAPPPLHG